MNEKSALLDRLEELKALNRNRYSYVIARAESRSIAAAVDKIGLSTGWYYKFPEEERQRLEEMAQTLHYEKIAQAYLALAESSIDAARVKVSGLTSEDERIQQDAATEILSRTLGKPGQRDDAPQTSSVTLNIIGLDDILSRVYGRADDRDT